MDTNIEKKSEHTEEKYFSVKNIEKEIEQEITLKKEPWFLFGIAAIAFIVVFVVWVFLSTSNNQIQIDDSQITAPVITIASKMGGTLQDVYVKTGDMVDANTVLERVGTELLKTSSPAEVVQINDTTGAVFTSGQPVVSVVDPSALRVVGQIEEDKGLKDVRVGQKAIFTVDAFGSKEFNGIVDGISPTSDTADVVFSISDKRAENNFDIKVRFDTTLYPELKNGMSAKITIFKN